MLIIKSKNQLIKTTEELNNQKVTIGFVPTMGALHEGHLSLIKNAHKNTQKVIVSIFVNPTQFNNTSDLDTYPRTLEADITYIKSHFPETIIYAPTPQEVYGANVTSKSYNFGAIEHVMEGEHRPGHFDGVGTVLNLLFRQVNPDQAFFGEKDFQQLCIVKSLVDKERLTLKIVGCPIHRRPSGLAMSSRNARLTPQHLAVAPFIYKTLQDVKNDFSNKSALQLKKWVKNQFNTQPLLKLEYFEIANIKNLKPLSRKHKHQQYRAFIAVWAGDVRLIDNIALN